MDERLQLVVDALAIEAGLPAVMEDTDLHLIAFSTHTRAVDPVRGASILRRQASPQVRSYLLRFVRGAVEPRRIPPNDALGMAARLCVPVVHGAVPVGFVWFVDPGKTITLAQVRRCLALAANVAPALAQLRNAKLTDPAAALVAVLTDPRQADAVAPALHARAGERPFVLAAIGTVGDEVAVSTLAGALKEAVRETRVASGRGVVDAVHDGRCALLIPEGDDPRAEHLLNVLLSRTESALSRGGLLVQVVAGAGSARERLDAAADAWREACALLRANEVFPQLRPAAHWGRLGTFDLPVRLAADPAVTLHPGVAALAADSHDAALLDTAEVYLDVAGNAQAAAQRLNLHRTSLYHRLHRIERLAGVDLKDGADRMALHLSIKIARLRGDYRRRPRLAAVS